MIICKLSDLKEEKIPCAVTQCWSVCFGVKREYEDNNGGDQQ